MKEKIKKKKKKKLSKLLLALVVLVAAVLIILPYTMETVPSSLALSQHTKNPPKLIAHRGLSGIFPQNTIPAFSGAEEYGFWGTECDIHSTKDGEWVIIHDEEISNLTDGEGYIKDMTFEEIQNIMVDSGNGIEEFGKLPLPTFEEFLSICEKGDLVPIIELKSADTKLFPELKKIIDSFDLSDDVAVISFNREYLTEYRKIDKDITLHLLVHTPTKDDVEFCTNNDIDCLNFNHTCLYKAIPAVLQAKKNGLELAAFTVDNTAFSDVMAIFGADYITTNKIIP